MRPIQKHSPRRSGLAALALSAILAGCGTVEDTLDSNWLPDVGYEKVPNRTRDAIPRAAAPDPPPAVALIGPGGGDIPVLAAGSVPAGVTQEMVEEGARLYGSTCSACHGAAGSGTPAGPQLNDASWIHVSGAYEEIVSLIHAGVPAPREYPAPMPPLGGGSFDDEQVRAIAAYVFALSHAEGT